MSKYNVTVTLREETNQFYDPKLSRNGGGYSQPYIEFTCLLGNGWISDNSCGEFGTRISAGFITNPDRYGMKYEFRADWGTMDKSPAASNFLIEYADLYEEICEVTGYRIPDWQQVEEMNSKM